MLKGKVSRVILDKGYGFIAGEDHKDYFFHMSSVNPQWLAFRHLAEGTAVSFNPAPSSVQGRCLQAKDINDYNYVPTETPVQTEETQV